MEVDSEEMPQDDEKLDELLEKCNKILGEEQKKFAID